MKSLVKNAQLKLNSRDLNTIFGSRLLLDISCVVVNGGDTFGFNLMITIR